MKVQSILVSVGCSFWSFFFWLIVCVLFLKFILTSLYGTIHARDGYSYFKFSGPVSGNIYKVPVNNPHRGQTVDFVVSIKESSQLFQRYLLRKFAYFVREFFFARQAKRKLAKS